MAAVVENLPTDVGLALDLLVGAGAAYASAVRANRILSSAAAYLHGVCVAVLVQAIAFTALVLVSQQSQGPTVLEWGPFRFVSVLPQTIFWGPRFALGILTRPVLGSAPALALLMLLLASLALFLAAPRWLRRSLT
jgi:hypothetical protein